jgi:hypothetical protein
MRIFDDPENFRDDIYRSPFFPKALFNNYIESAQSRSNLAP